jgi:2-polyprenyl-3-methyl-5-hydroxy-6-metoxy-1,4-benzoquinol methylase
MPKPCDLVVCTDVLEHVEEDKIDSVLDHIFRLSAKSTYLVISTKPAKTILPDGRNAHLIIRPLDWWMKKITEQGWKGAQRVEEVQGKEVRIWLSK